MKEEDREDPDKKKVPCTPREMLLAVLMDAVVIVGSYVVLGMTLRNNANSPVSTISWDGTLSFLAVFTPLAFAIKALNLEYADQLARVATFHLGTKMFNILGS